MYNFVILYARCCTRSKKVYLSIKKFLKFLTICRVCVCVCVFVRAPEVAQVWWKPEGGTLASHNTTAGGPRLHPCKPFLCCSSSSIMHPSWLLWHRDHLDFQSPLGQVLVWGDERTRRKKTESGNVIENGALTRAGWMDNWRAEMTEMRI